jgi:hypothetical protein
MLPLLVKEGFREAPGWFGYAALLAAGELVVARAARYASTMSCSVRVRLLPGQG